MSLKTHPHPTPQESSADRSGADKARHIFRLDQGTPRAKLGEFPKRSAVHRPDGTVRAYDLHFEPCVEPFCPCVRLTVEAVPCSTENVSGDGRLRFEIDLDVCDVVIDRTGGAPREQTAQARRLVSTWDAEVWDAVFQAFYDVREELLDGLDLRRAGADIPFPVDGIESAWWAVGWSEIVPFDRRFSVRTDAFLFVVDDLYCLRCRVPVDEVILAFVSAREVDGLDPSREPFMGPVSVARLDPERGTWTREEEQDGAPLDVLVPQALALPELLPTLQRRMELLRGMYRNRLRAVGYRPEPLHILLRNLSLAGAEELDVEPVLRRRGEDLK